MIYATISEVTDKAGTTIQARGRFDADLFLEAMETIEIDFDPDGSPRFPSLHIHPSSSKDVHRVREEFEASPRLQKRMEEVLEQQRAAWLAREGRRKLVG